MPDLPPLDASRRAFLLRIARAAAYTAPVVVSLAAPAALSAQQTQSQKDAGGGGGGMGGMTKQAISDFSTDLNTQARPRAPWSVAPPGSSGPPGGE